MKMQYREAERLQKQIAKLNLVTMRYCDIVGQTGAYAVDMEVGEYDAPLRFTAETKADGQKILARLKRDAEKL